MVRGHRLIIPINSFQRQFFCFWISSSNLNQIFYEVFYTLTPGRIHDSPMESSCSKAACSLLVCCYKSSGEEMVWELFWYVDGLRVVPFLIVCTSIFFCWIRAGFYVAGCSTYIILLGPLYVKVTKCVWKILSQQYLKLSVFSPKNVSDAGQSSSKSDIF